MKYMDRVFIVYGVIFCSVWVLIYLALMLAGRKLTFFSELTTVTPETWPKLSVIVPACNEEQHIEQAALSLIKQDYPNFEIILVNDRSDDNTGKIIDKLAAVHTQVTAVHIQDLPDNWLGKVHALYKGMQSTSGDWVLFTDADIQYSSGVLSKAISYAEEKNIDHLALMPGVKMNSFLLEVVIRTFGLIFLLTTRAASVNKPGSKAVIGVGAFNLVKRNIFNKTPGFEWLRMETVDDMGVGLMMRKAGSKSCFAIADKELSLGWYNSLPAMFKGLEKNLFGAGTGYNVYVLAVQVLLVWGLLAAPAIGLTSDNPLLFSLAQFVVFLYFIFAFFFTQEKQSETLSLLMFPAGLLLLTFMMIWSAYQCLKNNGINWRGTHYSISELRAGQRVRF